MSIDERQREGDSFVVMPLPAREEPLPTRRASQEPESTIGTARWYQWQLFGGINTTQLVNFCRQFANYLDAGVNLNRALESLRRQYERSALGPVIGRLQLAVRRGETLTDAMARDAGVSTASSSA